MRIEEQEKHHVGVMLQSILGKSGLQIWFNEFEHLRAGIILRRHY
jgi:hypothetical protein